MKAAEIRSFGIAQITIADRPEPKPGPREVLVRMQACSLNYRDLMVAEGTYNPRMKLPMVPLSDGSGEVVAVGSEVTRFRAGQRVLAAFMQQWLDGPVTEEIAKSALGGGIDGIAAEYVCFHEEGLVEVPEYLSWEEAATLPCAGVTAWHGLVTAGHLRPGQKVALLGTGGVSIFGLQIAQLMHGEAIITSSSDEKLARAKELGAAAGINYQQVPEWSKPVREWAGGAGVDNILEVGGTGTLPQSLRAVRMGGIVTLIGVLSGAADVSFIPIFMRSIRVNGIYVGSRAMLEDLLRAMTGKQMRPVIEKTFPFTELREALAFMQAGSHFGKICIRFD